MSCIKRVGGTNQHSVTVVISCLLGWLLEKEQLMDLYCHLDTTIGDLHTKNQLLCNIIVLLRLC